MKYINADKLKGRLTSYMLFEWQKDYLKNIIDELSEEREDGFTLEDIEKAIRFGELSTKESSIKLFEKKGLLLMEVTKQFIQSLKQPNTLKVAIKGDGTEEYGKKIIEYFEKLGADNSFNRFDGSSDGYYYIEEDGCLSGKNQLPEGYTEISLKEEESWLDKDERLFHKEEEKEYKCGLNEAIGAFSKFGSNSEDVIKSLKEQYEPHGLIPDLNELIESYKTAEKLCERILYYINRNKELETDNAALCKELTDLKLKLKDLIK